MRPIAAAILFAALTSATAFAAPANDLCSQATEVPEQSRNRFFATLDLGTATASRGDPQGYCLDASAEHTVWLRWTADNDGTLYGTNARKAARRIRFAAKRARALQRFLARAAGKQKLPQAAPLIETAGELVDLLAGGG